MKQAICQDKQPRGIFWTACECCARIWKWNKNPRRKYSEISSYNNRQLPTTWEKLTKQNTFRNNFYYLVRLMRLPSQMEFDVIIYLSSRNVEQIISLFFCFSYHTHGLFVDFEYHRWRLEWHGELRELQPPPILLTTLRHMHTVHLSNNETSRRLRRSSSSPSSSSPSC